MLNRASEHYGFFGLNRGGITYKEAKISCAPIPVLNEFHHAMSHLCEVFLKDDARYTNLERAIPHFKRGMMDIYIYIYIKNNHQRFSYIKPRCFRGQTRSSKNKRIRISNHRKTQKSNKKSYLKPNQQKRRKSYPRI